MRQKGMVSTVSHENMRTAAAPSRGSMVVYVAGLRESGKQRFRIADVVGPTTVDPVTGHVWFGVLLSDRLGGVVDLIDSVSVMNVVPPD
jgi:hypothetical protein